MIDGWTFVSNSCLRLLLFSRTVRASSSSSFFGLSDFSAPMRSQNDIRFVSATLPDVISLYSLGLNDFFTVLHSTWGTSEKSEVSESCLLHAAPLFTMRVWGKNSFRHLLCQFVPPPISILSVCYLLQLSGFVFLHLFNKRCLSKFRRMF